MILSQKPVYSQQWPLSGQRWLYKMPSGHDKSQGDARTIEPANSYTTETLCSSVPDNPREKIVPCKIAGNSSPWPTLPKVWTCLQKSSLGSEKWHKKGKFATGSANSSISNSYKTLKVGHGDLLLTNLVEVDQMHLHAKYERNLYRPFGEEVENVIFTLINTISRN